MNQKTDLERIVGNPSVKSVREGLLVTREEFHEAPQSGCGGVTSTSMQVSCWNLLVWDKNFSAHLI
jgi:hypothetical protein